jgi:hypothetical protein
MENMCTEVFPRGIYTTKYTGQENVDLIYIWVLATIIPMYITTPVNQIESVPTVS